MGAHEPYRSIETPWTGIASCLIADVFYVIYQEAGFGGNVSIPLIYQSEPPAVYYVLSIPDLLAEKRYVHDFATCDWQCS